MAGGVSGAGIKPMSPQLASGLFTSELPGQPQLPHFTSEDCASREVTSLTQGHIITKPKIPNFPTMVLQSIHPTTPIPLGFILHAEKVPFMALASFRPQEHIYLKCILRYWGKKD